jgi:hypothetical protein
MGRLAAWTIAAATHVSQAALLDEATCQEQFFRDAVRARHHHVRRLIEFKSQRLA